MVFKDYDFKKNPLSIPKDVLDIIHKTTFAITPICLADSVGIDFHKLAYAPLTSSCFLLKHNTDFHLLKIYENNFDDKSLKIDAYHPGDYSLECSRSATGSLSAYVNLISIGKNGFRLLLAHQMLMAFNAHSMLSKIPNCLVINELHGPAIVFRFYKNVTPTIDSLYEEICGVANATDITKNNELTKNIYNKLLALHKTTNIAIISFMKNYKENGEISISALKLFIASPFTTTEIIERTMMSIASIAEELI